MAFWGGRRANFYGREDFSEEGMGPKEISFAEGVLRSMHEDLSEGVFKSFLQGCTGFSKIFPNKQPGELLDKTLKVVPTEAP